MHKVPASITRKHHFCFVILHLSLGVNAHRLCLTTLCMAQNTNPSTTCLLRNYAINQNYICFCLCILYVHARWLSHISHVFLACLVHILRKLWLITQILFLLILVWFIYESVLKFLSLNLHMSIVIQTIFFYEKSHERVNKN